jgi:hypothetical protein
VVRVRSPVLVERAEPQGDQLGSGVRYGAQSWLAFATASPTSWP